MFFQSPLQVSRGWTKLPAADYPKAGRRLSAEGQVVERHSLLWSSSSAGRWCTMNRGFSFHSKKPRQKSRQTSPRWDSIWQTLRTENQRGDVCREFFLGFFE